MRILLTSVALVSLLGLAATGCEVAAPTGDIEPEPAAQAAPDPAPAPAVAPTPSPADTPTAPTAQQPPAVDPGSCCGSEACGQAGHGGSGGCGCRRNLPPEVAAQVNCGG